MATRSKPYEQLGRYLLFKRFESTKTVETWRGAIAGREGVGPALVIHRFAGGDLQAIRDCVEQARTLVPSIAGTTVVREQNLDIVEGVPLLTHEYSTGRTLRHIVDRARGSVTPAAPVPVDQALAIAERIALSLETLNTMKYGSTRLVHGALLPRFVWITEEGEVRVAGHLLGPGLIASLRNPDTAKELSPWYPPEVRESGQPTRCSDAYALGAVLYLLLTGEEPPDPVDAAAHAAALSGAVLQAGGAPIPPEIRPVLEKALSLDPARRYASAAEFREPIGALTHGGTFAPTTFNLAFYLHNLLKKEMETEAVEREREAKVHVAPLSEPASLNASLNAAEERPTQPLGQPFPPARSRVPIIAAAAALVVIGAAAGTYLVFGRRPSPPPSATKPAAAPAAVKPALAPIVESVHSGTAPATTTVDPEGEKRAFEEAVNRKLQQEMLKLQAEFDAKNRTKLAGGPAAVPPAAQPAVLQQTRAAEPEDRPVISAEQLDQVRRESAQAATLQTAPVPVAPVVPAKTVPVPQAAPAPPPVAEGDLIGLQQLDSAPKVTRRAKVMYPPVAEREKIEGSVVMSVLVTETGRVADVRVLRSDTRGRGFEEAAVRSVKGWLFTPGMKDAKRVRTWMPIAVDFKLH